MLVLDLTSFLPKEEQKEGTGESPASISQSRDLLITAEKTDYSSLTPDKLTPGMRQFVEVKKQHPDCLVLFRMGDFYETFYDDAKLVARELDIVLTARGAGEKRAPLAGIPYHALESYLAKLVKKGYKVAIVEQLEDPKKAKGLVKRGLVRIVTPGTIIEQGMLDAGSHNYLMSLYVYDEKLAFALCDISTGEFLVAESSVEQLAHHLARFAPAECVIPQSLAVNGELLGLLQTHKVFVNPVEDRVFQREQAVQALSEHFHTFGADGFGLGGLLVQPAGALLSYIMETQKVMLRSINSIRTLNLSSTMVLDSSTLRNLELLRNSRDGTMKATLLSVLDKTKTSMGSRLLRSWVKEPLLEVGQINERLDAVGWLKDNTLKRAEIVALLSTLHDVQRLIGRVAFGAANARDLLALKLSLRVVPHIAAAVRDSTVVLLQTIAGMPSAAVVVDLIERAILDEPSAVLNEGNLLKRGYHDELDKLHDVRKNSKLIIKGIEDREKARTGIKTLRVGFNNVFGYFIEVSKSYIPQVPSDFIRKQTTANGERYVTQELKEQEELILHAEEKICALEFELFQDIVQQINEHTIVVQDIASRLALLDVLVSLAVCAADYRYRKPIVDESGEIILIGSRHPVLEQIERGFVANDVQFGKNEMMVITGPNMAGKCLTGESIVFSNEGMIPIKHFKPAMIRQERFYPLNLTISGINGKEKTSHFYYDGKRPTIRVATKFGYEIEGTANHPILVRTKEGKEIWRKLGNIRKGDFIIINRKINLWGKTTKVPEKIIKQVSNYDYNGRVIQYKLPRYVDEDLAYVVGLLIGDGTLTYKNYLTLSNIDKQIIDDFSRILKEKFGCSVYSKKKNMDHCVSSKRIRLFFEALGLDYVDCFDKEVPTCILKAPKNIVRLFISGLFDADGDANNRYGGVSLSTCSLKLAKQVQLILLNFGIIASLTEKKTKFNLNYRISIYGENAILFHKNVGFKLDRKRIRGELASKIRMPNYGIPHMELLLKEIQARIVSKKDKKIALKKVKAINSIFYTYLPSQRNVSYRKLKELIDYCDLNRVHCDELKQIYNHYYFYDSIKWIRRSDTSQDVYDFSVPKTHSFTANGLVNHNSTFMRQTALTVLMAQVGSFVPADEARIGVVDRIFTRVGAMDDLSTGQSTFMMEMNETAAILHNATSRSLIILDEIGRGTSTFDGVSIAWSVAEHILNCLKAKTLFATHYHVMNTLAETHPSVTNYTVAVKEDGADVIFLHKIVKGSTDQSYGIHVARLAGLPADVIARALEIQKKFEKEDGMASKIK